MYQWVNISNYFCLLFPFSSNKFSTGKSDGIIGNYQSEWNIIVSHNTNALLELKRKLEDIQEKSKDIQGDPKDIVMLFDHADLVLPLFNSKVIEWQNKCSSIGIVSSHLSEVKCAIRSMQKVYRSYNKDWRNLCDLVRASLVFDDITIIVKCLEKINEDKEVSISLMTPTKFRFDLNYDAAKESLGYRDIQLSIRLRGYPDAIRLAVDGFVCELQLHLTSLFYLKSVEGHKLYKWLRNFIAE
jgi:hypothetical protein